MNKERLTAFTDAILAIIMTILVLELEKPESATWAAIWALRASFFSYAISFFWLGTMWVNLHSQWQKVTKIDNRVVWCSIVMLFFSSFFPYVTDFVAKNFMSRFAQGTYLVVVLGVSLSNMALNYFVGKANEDNMEFVAETRQVGRIMWIDIAIKLIGFVIAMLIWPPLTMLFVILAGILPTMVAHKMHRGTDVE